MTQISMDVSKAMGERRLVVKWHTYLRLLAVPLLTVFLLAPAPLVEAANFPWPNYFRVKDKRKDNDDKDRKKASVPEGSGSAALVLAATALGGGLLVSRRKRRAKVA
jgi:hypothetical protein